MVLLSATPQILSAISSLSPAQRASFSSLPQTPGAPVEHAILVSISHSGNGPTLNSLLKGTRVYVPPPPPRPEPSPEYVALMARLKREQEQKEYTALVAKQIQEAGDPAEEHDDISPSLVFNILVSVVMCAAAMFYLTRYWHNDGLRVLSSLAVGILVGVAEVTVYAAYLRKVNESKMKERRRKERKTIIGEYTGDNAIPLESNEQLDLVLADKEEIWGRGKHGGMRRRVRDRWEKENVSSN